MRKYISKELREALDDPWTRDRLVDAWLICKKREELDAKIKANDRAEKILKAYRDAETKLQNGEPTK